MNIVKSDDARGRWGRPFASCYQHRLMLKNSEDHCRGVTFIPMPMPKIVCIPNLYNK